MSYLSRKSALLSGCMVAAVIVLVSGTSFAPVPTARTEWLNLTRVNVSFPVTFGRDSMSVAGSFNMAPDSVDPATASVTVAIDGAYFTFSEADWKQVGTSGKYTAKLVEGDSKATAQITWWVGGTSRCDFKFTGARQDIQSALNEPWYYDDPADDMMPHGRFLTVTVMVNEVFEDSLYLLMYRNKAAGRLFYVWQSCMLVDHMTVNRNLKAASRDSVSVKGRMYVDLVGNIESDVTGIVITLGRFSCRIDGSQLKVRGVTAKASVVYETGEKVSFAWNGVSGKFTVVARNLDMSGMDNPIAAGVNLEGVFDADLAVQMQLKPNKTATIYTY